MSSIEPTTLRQNQSVHHPEPSVFIGEFEDLDKQFFIGQRFSFPSYLEDYFLKPSNRLLLVDGHLHLRHGLQLDWGKLEDIFDNKGHDVLGLIVMGDLLLEGDLMNQNLDGGPLLLVRGNLTANNLLGGGASIIVGRDASIRDIVIGIYNHGDLNVGCELHAGMVVMRDHCFSVRRIHASHVVPNDMKLDPDSDDGTENLPGRLHLFVMTPWMAPENLVHAQ